MFRSSFGNIYKIIPFFSPDCISSRVHIYEIYTIIYIIFTISPIYIREKEHYIRLNDLSSSNSHLYLCNRKKEELWKLVIQI
ncbi:MAG: hypothetical protein DBY16_04915 [Coprobacter sp.]|nr:MAG: hypothetical protein DBY16_04915 [Coprobacter sp.]